MYPCCWIGFLKTHLFKRVSKNESHLKRVSCTFVNETIFIEPCWTGLPESLNDPLKLHGDLKNVYNFVASVKRWAPGRK